MGPKDWRRGRLGLTNGPPEAKTPFKCPGRLAVAQDFVVVETTDQEISVNTGAGQEGNHEPSGHELLHVHVSPSMTEHQHAPPHGGDGKAIRTPGSCPRSHGRRAINAALAGPERKGGQGRTSRCFTRMTRTFRATPSQFCRLRLHRPSSPSAGDPIHIAPHISNRQRDNHLCLRQIIRAVVAVRAEMFAGHPGQRQDVESRC